MGFIPKFMLLSYLMDVESIEIEMSRLSFEELVLFKFSRSDI
jgi:hypothetical protein